MKIKIIITVNDWFRLLICRKERGKEFSLLEPSLCSKDLGMACMNNFEHCHCLKELVDTMIFGFSGLNYVSTSNKNSKALLNFCKRLAIYVLLSKAYPIVTLPVFFNPGRRFFTVKNKEIMTFLAKKYRFRHT
jgi:hypothetical protein